MTHNTFHLLPADLTTCVTRVNDRCWLKIRGEHLCDVLRSSLYLHVTSYNTLRTTALRYWKVPYTVLQHTFCSGCCTAYSHSSLRHPPLDSSFMSLPFIYVSRRLFSSITGLGGGWGRRRGGNDGDYLVFVYKYVFGVLSSIVEQV